MVGKRCLLLLSKPEAQIKRTSSLVWARLIRFSPDGKTIACASNDQTIKLWKSDGGKWNYYNTLTGHSDRVKSVSFSPDGQIIASASDHKTIKLWTDGTGIDPLTGHQDGVKSVSFSPDGNIVSTSSDGKVIRWSLNLDDLVAQECEWRQDYFVTHPQEHNSLKVCDRTFVK